MSTRHVLIVDDLYDIRHILRSSLETLELDIDITDVPSGEEAMLVISRRKYDLLVSDVRLAGISGLDLVRKVRRGNPDLKVILITGMADSEIRQQVAEFGADKYFFKPIDLIEFQKCVAGFLGFDAVQLPEPPVDQIRKVAAEISLPDRLMELRSEMQADCVWVADLNGKVIVQVGEMPEGWSSAEWKSVLYAGSAASLDVARALERDFPRNYLYISGGVYDLHTVSLGWMYLLLVAAPHRAESDPFTGFHGLFQHTEEVLTSLAVYLASVTQEEARVGTVEAESPVNAVDTGQLEEVIQQAGKSGLNLQEIDDYWEALADQQDIGEQSGKGSLSYEQARKLGLTPEE